MNKKQLKKLEKIINKKIKITRKHKKDIKNYVVKSLVSQALANNENQTLNPLKIEVPLSFEIDNAFIINIIINMLKANQKIK